MEEMLAPVSYLVSAAFSPVEDWGLLTYHSP